VGTTGGSPGSVPAPLADGSADGRAGSSLLPGVILASVAFCLCGAICGAFRQKLRARRLPNTRFEPAAQDPSLDCIHAPEGAGECSHDAPEDDLERQRDRSQTDAFDDDSSVGRGSAPLHVQETPMPMHARGQHGWGVRDWGADLNKGLHADDAHEAIACIDIRDPACNVLGERTSSDAFTACGLICFQEDSKVVASDGQLVDNPDDDSSQRAGCTMHACHQSTGEQDLPAGNTKPSIGCSGQQGTFPFCSSGPSAPYTSTRQIGLGL